ncbi:15803_t:CDS:2, partial [Dentiscutata heterogama]
LAPNSNEAVFKLIDMYLEDLEQNVIDLYTSKAICSALIAAFSGYVLKLIHTAVGIAIHLYLNNNNILLNTETIFKRDKNILKVWYLYYCLAGYWKAHHIGICLDNADMQLKSLAAFALLFPATSKNIYILSVVTFLKSVSCNPQQYELFKHIALVNITRENHYLAYNEVLKQYGIKFVKQNLTSGLSDPNTLKQKITAIQDEYKRLLLLYDEFVEDNV